MGIGTTINPANPAVAEIGEEAPFSREDALPEFDRNDFLQQQRAGSPPLTDPDPPIRFAGAINLNDAMQIMDRALLQGYMRGDDSGQFLEVIERHNLAESFKQHLEYQLRNYGEIRVGIIDNFSSGTHGKNVENRLLASVPDHLRPYVQIIRYDVGIDREGAFNDAIQDAGSKNIVALSVSGGLESLDLANLESLLGEPLTQENRRDALTIGLGLLQDRSYARTLNILSHVSTVIPIVTPVWNDGRITPAGLGENTIVTSISDPNSNRTEAPGIVDVEVEGMPGNPNTSQSAPIFLGQLLGIISEEELIGIVGRR